MERVQNIPRVGRNDPCPCGSGKKYKNCHMLQAQQAVSGAVQRRRARETAYEKLAAFVQGERFVADLAAAIEFYWQGRLHPSHVDKVLPLHRMRSLDYFLFDYRTADGDRVIERFLTERVLKVSPDEKSVLRAWEKAHLGIYAILRADTTSLTVRDLCQGGEQRVEGGFPPPIAQPGIALVGRLAADTPAYFVNELVLPMPSGKAAQLVDWLKPRFTAFQEQHYGASWPDFWRRESHLVNAFLMEDQEFLPASASPVTQPDVDKDLEVARGIVRQMHGGLIIGTLDSHYGQFLDRPVVDWGNRSPRQLMVDPQGRERVALWLEMLEEAETGRRAIGQPAYDVNRLRAQLGMLGPGVY